MEDDESKSRQQYPLATAKMSKTPSWIMLGFLLGAAFVAALPPLRKKPPEAATFTAVESPKPTGPRAQPQITTIEAVFDIWGSNAVWADDITEVALWIGDDNAFSEFYEVRRFGTTYYFRSIPQLTRRIISHGKPLTISPLQFTETEEQYREWRTYGRTERAVDRDTRPRPSFTAPSAPDPIDRSVKMSAPSLPPPTIERSVPALELPAVNSAAKK